MDSMLLICIYIKLREKRNFFCFKRKKEKVLHTLLNIKSSSNVNVMYICSCTCTVYPAGSFFCLLTHICMEKDEASRDRGLGR